MVVSAKRTPRNVFGISKSQRQGIVLGLRYERRFLKVLKSTVGSRSLEVEHNPWFTYTTDSLVDKSGVCCPDILVHETLTDITWVLEVKYTWVADALEKLTNLYVPVVELALERRALPLVVCKRLTPESPQPKLSLFGLVPDNPNQALSEVYQWMELGPLIL